MASATGTVDTWSGTGSAGSGGSNWDVVGNYTGGNAFSNTNDLDFSTISTTSTVTLSASTSGTFTVRSIYFNDGTTNSSVADNINFNGNGTAGAVTLNFGPASGTGTISLPSVSGSLLTFGSDLTVNLTNGYHYFSVEPDTAVTAAPAVAPALVMNSLVTGGGSNTTMFLSYGQYGSTSSLSAGPTVVLTNDSNSFVGSISVVGNLYFTSVGNAGTGTVTGPDSALGAASGTATLSTIGLSNGGSLYLIGSQGSQSTNRNLNYGGGNIIGNYASSTATLTFNGTATDAGTSGGTGKFTFVDTTGNAIAFNGVIQDGVTSSGTQTGNVESVVKGAGTSYVNTSGALVANTDGGGTLYLNGLNAYNGTTTINAGVLSINTIANGGVTVTPNGVTVGTNTLTFSSTTGLAVGQSITGAGIGEGATITGINLTTDTATLSVNNTVTVTTASLVETTGTANSLGISTNAASNLLITNGTLQYTGGTASTDRLFTINGTTGTNTATLDGSGTGPIDFTNTGAIAYGTAGTNALAEQRALFLTGTNTGANTLSAAIGNNGSATGTSTNSQVSVTKTGVGSWTLTGSNTYTGGTSVSAGTLLIANTSGSALGTGALTVAAGAGFGGTGSATGLSTFNIGSGSSTMAQVQVGGGGIDTTSTLTLGATTGTITNTNLTFNLSSTTASQGNQLAITTSALAFTGTLSTVTLNIVGGSVISPNTPYVLVTDANGFNGLTVTGPNDIITNGLSIATNPFFTANGTYTNGFYNGSYLFENAAGTEIEVEVVPEPSTWAMMLGGLGVLGLILRRKRQRM